MSREKKNLVSVIVPVYNVENYVDACVQSIINQSYKNLDIILVDDGSEDASSVKCDEWKEKDERITVIHQANQGLSGARNVGLYQCAGEWILFVDSDDEIDHRLIERLLCLTQKYGVDVAQCKSQAMEKRQNSLNGLSYVEGSMSGREFLLSSYYDTMAWGKIYRKTCFSNITFPLGKVYEDSAIMYKIIYGETKVAFTTEKLYFTNRRAESINTTTSYDLKRLVKLDFILEEMDYFNKKKEMELVHQTKRNFLFESLYCYSQVKKYMPSEKAVLKEILRKYKKVSKGIWRDEDIKIRTKTIIVVSRYFPEIGVNLFIR